MRITTTIEIKPKILLNIAITVSTLTVLILLYAHESSSRKTRNASFSLTEEPGFFEGGDSYHGEKSMKSQQLKDLPFDDTFEVDLVSDPVLERPIDENNQNDLGEGGTAVHIPDNKLSEKEKLLKEKMIKKYAINHFIGDKISLHRTTGDHRQKECKKVKYDEKLPTTSVIVTFYNEHWTTLLRTIYSILHESSKSTLKEIILVDDMSDQDHLQVRLERTLKDLPRVRLIRTTTRQGLVRARMLGAQYASGDVLTFLDCHIECNPGWLEPLLQKIKDQPKTIAVPVITTISWENFAFHGMGTNPQIGGFDWRLTFQWHSIPDSENERRSSTIDSIRSPTMAGGLFAIGKEWFEYLGMYDSGMDIWGGENLELSWRVWMCGGTLEIIPCSIVGHVFPKEAPYARPNFVENTLRAVEVWMPDKYKRHFYIRNPKAKDVDFGDISERLALKEALNCKSFEWYLTNVYSDLHIPDDIPGQYGALESLSKKASKSYNFCIDYNPPDHQPTKGIVSTYPCHGQGGNQFFEMTEIGEIRYNHEKEICLTAKFTADSITKLQLTAELCSDEDDQLFIFDKDNSKTIKSQIGNNQCITLSDEKDAAGFPKIKLASCRNNYDSQKWQFNSNGAGL